MNNMYSFWFYKRSSYLQVLGIWCQNEFCYWFGSEVSNTLFRLLGVSIGKRVVIETPATSLIDLDLVSVGDDCVVEYKVTNKL
jgi:hypothetical protein